MLISCLSVLPDPEVLQEVGRRVVSRELLVGDVAPQVSVDHHHGVLARVVEAEAEVVPTQRGPVLAQHVPEEKEKENLVLNNQAQSKTLNFKRTSKFPVPARMWATQ